MILEKEDVSLYYEVRGEGEGLFLIHGVVVDAGLYSHTAEILSRFYRVVTFDRRGNSRSVCKGERIFDIDKQIEDIRDLMDALGMEQAYFVGASGGAVIGEYFLQRYPQRVKHLIMYEPAMLGIMQDQEEVAQWVNQMKDLIARRKYNTAILKFSQHIASYDTRGPKKDPAVSMREMGNFEYMLTQEFPALISYQPDLEKMLALSDRVSLAAGEKSGETAYANAARLLAQKLGKKELYYPGYHNLPFDLPREFAVCVLGTLLLDAKETNS